MGKDLLGVIETKTKNFSKGQKRIGSFIVQHYEKAAFMTAAKLGATVGVSESTVVRFASEIGFEGYPQLQQALQELIKNRLTSVQRMEVTNEQIGSDDVLSKVLNLDIEKIKKTLDRISKEDFDRSVEAILKARRIYIIGVRSASALAGFLSFYFNHLFENVRLVDTSSTSEIFEQIFRIEKGDVFIAITFPRYSKRTVKAAEFAHDNGAAVIAITDSTQAPVAESADYMLLARSDMASFVDSLVAPLSLINALIVAVGLKKQDELAKTFSTLERIWDEYSVYEKAGEEAAGEAAGKDVED